jgi:hypothetical protein
MMGPEWFVVFLVFACGLASGFIWQNKGGNFALGFVLGLFLGLIGLIIVAVAQPGGSRSVLPPAGPAQPAITWTHTGSRYLMGYTLSPTAYGIWDRGAPGPPILRFPYTEHGKSEALAKYAELEPTGVAIAAPSPPPPPPPPLPLDR